MDTREDFCGLCAAIPVALAGIGASSYVANGSEYKNKKVLLVLGCALTVVVCIFFLIKYSDCKFCKSNK